MEIPSHVCVVASFHQLHTISNMFKTCSVLVAHFLLICKRLMPNRELWRSRRWVLNVLTKADICMMDQGWESETQRCESIWKSFQQIHLKNISTNTFNNLDKYICQFGKNHFRYRSRKCSDKGWHMMNHGWESVKVESLKLEMCADHAWKVSNKRIVKTSLKRNLHLVCVFGSVQNWEDGAKVLSLILC